MSVLNYYSENLFIEEQDGYKYNIIERIQTLSIDIILTSSVFKKQGSMRRYNLITKVPIKPTYIIGWRESNTDANYTFQFSTATTSINRARNRMIRMFKAVSKGTEIVAKPKEPDYSFLNK